MAKTIAKCCGSCGLSFHSPCDHTDHCILIEKKLRKNEEPTGHYEYGEEESKVNSYELKSCFVEPISYGKGSDCKNCIHLECKNKKDNHFCGAWQQGNGDNSNAT